MKFLYCTDLHGHKLKYDKVFKFAKENEISVLNIGADLLPNYAIEQKDFVTQFLNKYFLKCEKNNITLLAQFGNDDPWYLKKEYKGHILDEKPFQYESYIFYGYNYVPDYPFCNKDICKLDYRGWQRPKKEEYNLGYEPKLKKGIIDELDFLYEMTIKYRSDISYYNPFYFNDNGEKIQIKNLDEYLNNKTTIEEDLKNIKCDRNAIYCFHTPPYKLGLDVTRKKRDGVGSKSVYDWILREQPMLTLHGHIHESFDISKKWKENICKTVVIQPGQSTKNFNTVILVYIEIENDKVIASRMEI